MTEVEVLLREAMDERGAAFTPAAFTPARSWAPERRAAAWRPVLLVAASVVAVIGVAAGVVSHGLGRPATPAAPGTSSSAAGAAAGALASPTSAPGTPSTSESASALAWPTPAPGGDLVAPLADSVTMTATGTQTVELGTPPPEANAIDIQLTCLTPGTFRFADGASASCTSPNVGESPSAGYRIPVTADTRGTTITTSPDAQWRIVATYVKVTTTAWGVNERGQTYGVQNVNGTPDLVAVYATNGKSGYALAGDLEGPTPANPSEAMTWHSTPRKIPVFESDGVTVIGSFSLG